MIKSMEEGLKILKDVKINRDLFSIKPMNPMKSLLKKYYQRNLMYMSIIIVGVDNYLVFGMMDLICNIG